jgi:hypothetical protein
MSIYEQRTLTCPHCGHQAVQSVAVSLNAARARVQRQAIMDGTFQRFECDACRERYRADGPLIYIDFDEKLWIGVFPAPWESTWWKCEQEPALAFQRNVEENSPSMVKEWGPGFTIRTVFGLECLREKLVAYEAGVDDRVLEAFKLDLLRSMGPHELSRRARPRLREASASELSFDVPRPEPADPGRIAKVKVARAELARIDANRAAWDSVLATLSEGPYVDLGRIFIPVNSADEAA